MHEAVTAHVTLDLDGFRSGNLNAALAAAGGRSMIGMRVKLTFPEDLVREPIIARLVKSSMLSPTSGAPTWASTRAGSSASSTATPRGST